MITDFCVGDGHAKNNMVKSILDHFNLFLFAVNNSITWYGFVGFLNFGSRVTKWHCFETQFVFFTLPDISLFHLDVGMSILAGLQSISG